MDGEVGVAGEVADEVVDGAASESDDRAAVGADEVMPVAGGADDVGGPAVGAEEAREDVDGGEDFEGAVDRGAANGRGGVAEVGDELLGGEGAGVAEDGVKDGASGAGHPVAVGGEDGKDVRGRREGRSCGGERGCHGRKA